MIQSASKTELVRLAIQEIYQSPLAGQGYSGLSEAIRSWAEESPETDENEEKRIFDGLQSLTGFLQSKGHDSEADEVVGLILRFFPERYFPQLPRTRAYKEIDLRLFRLTRDSLGSTPNLEEKKEALALFEESFCEAVQNLQILVSEIAEGKFKSRNLGVAGDLFRSFSNAAKLLQDTPGKDNIWSLMNQLAMKINISLGGYHQAYLLMKGIESVKATKPTGWLLEEMKRNEIFFWRNYCWQNIDEALVAKDDSKLSYWIDNSLPFLETGYERDNLLAMKESVSHGAWHFSRMMLISCTILIAGSILVYTIRKNAQSAKSLDLDQSRKELVQAIRTGFNPETQQPEAWKQEITSDAEVQRRTALSESKPPLRPHGRPLNISEIRYAVFQKYRIDYLKEQELSIEESKKLAALEEDWLARCEFYEYKNEDREAVHWDLKINGPALIQEAQEILKTWRYGDDAENSPLDSNELMNLNNPLHVKLIISRLRQLKCFTASETPEIWDQECVFALKDFKATYLSKLDSVWDIDTQKALFGK